MNRVVKCGKPWSDVIIDVVKYSMKSSRVIQFLRSMSWKFNNSELDQTIPMRNYDSNKNLWLLNMPNVILCYFLSIGQEQN